MEPLTEALEAIVQGATWAPAPFLFWTDEHGNDPRDLSTTTALLQIREAPADTGAAVLLELSTENGGLVITTNELAIKATATETEALDFAGDEAVYDLFLTDSVGPTVTCEARGTVALIRSVSRRVEL